VGKAERGQVNGQPNGPSSNSVGLIRCTLFDMENWLFFSDPRFALQFQHPRLATDGEPVQREETQREGMLRIHVLAPKCREVYFEVTKYELLTPKDEYRRHTENLPELFEGVQISELKETRCASLPAYEYMFEWEQGTRSVMLVQRGAETYRILFNPRFPINVQIQSTGE